MNMMIMMMNYIEDMRKLKLVINEGVLIGVNSLNVSCHSYQHVFHDL